MVNTGVPPRAPADYGAILGWVRELGLEADFPEAVFLEMGAALEKPLTYDRIGVGYAAVRPPDPRLAAMMSMRSINFAGRGSVISSSSSSALI